MWFRARGSRQDSTALDETWALASNKPLHAFALLWTSYSPSFGDSDSGHNTPTPPINAGPTGWAPVMSLSHNEVPELSLGEPMVLKMREGWMQCSSIHLCFFFFPCSGICIMDFPWSISCSNLMMKSGLESMGIKVTLELEILRKRGFIFLFESLWDKGRTW